MKFTNVLAYNGVLIDTTFVEANLSVSFKLLNNLTNETLVIFIDCIYLYLNYFT